jgi:hypothetical protein
MSYSNNPLQSLQGADAACQTPADKLVLTPVFPIEVVEFGLVPTTSLADAAGGLVYKLDKRPTAGSDTDRGDGDIGILTLTAAQADALDAGTVAKCRMASPTVIYPGEQAVLELTTGVDSGAGVVFITFREYFADDDADEVVVAE